MDFPIFDVDPIVEELLSDSSSDEDNILGFSDLSPDSGHGSPNSAVSLSSDTSPYSDFRWESTSETVWDALSDDMESTIPLMDHDLTGTGGADLYKELTPINTEQTGEAFLTSQWTEILPQNDSDVVDNITVDVDWPMDMTFLDNPVKSEPVSPVAQKEEPKEEATQKVCNTEVKQNIHKGAVILNTSLKGGNGQGLTGILLKPVKNGNVTTYITVPVSFTSVKENEKVEAKEAVKEILKSKPVDKPQPVEEEKKVGNFSVSQGIGPNLVLTTEEKRLLDLEGYSLPTDMPLTKAEEKVLKKVRRKIKNKQSAMESRRRRKDYIDNLEKRVKDCTDKNAQLKKQVSSLTDENKSLASQLKELQALLAGSLTKQAAPNVARSAQTGTCLAVLLLSFALFVFPFNPFTSSVPGKTNVLQGVDPYAGAVVRSRTLLQVDDNTEYDYHEDTNESDAQTLASLADSLKLLQLGQSSLKGQVETDVLTEPSYRSALYFESSTQNSQDIILAFKESANQTEQRTLL